MKKLLINKTSANLFLKPLLRLDNFLYKMISALAIEKHGIHPKHGILNYTDWFVQHTSSQDVVLDVGCNTGTLPRALAQAVQFVYGIEIEKHLAAQAKEQTDAENVSYITADATTYDYSEMKPITVVTLSNVLEHIEHRVEFLQKLTTQVKWQDNPRFLIRVPMRDREWVSIYKKKQGIEWRLDTTHFTEYTQTEFEEEMHQAGLVVDQVSVRFGELYALCHKK